DGGHLDLSDQPLSLRLFLDRSMIEAYANQKKSITSRAFAARDDALGLRLIGAPNAIVTSLRIWRMDSAFGAKRPVGARGINIEPKTAWQSDLPNHDFQTCDLSGWTVTKGSAFSDRVVTRKRIFWNKVYFNPSFSIPGKCHLWGYNAWGGDAATGSMQTAPFILGGNGHINFLIAGGDDIDRVYIALVRAEDDSVLFKATGVDYEEYRREFWDASEHVGQRVYLKVVDASREDFGHINLDDIHVPFQKDVP
ncbi:MAG: GH32 C-terminal domain-containing protein, partial [Myxococcota bacterium]